MEHRQTDGHRHTFGHRPTANTVNAQIVKYILQVIMAPYNIIRF